MKYFSLSPGFATAPPLADLDENRPSLKKRPAPSKVPFPQLKVFSRPTISLTDTVFKLKGLKIFRRLRRAEQTTLLSTNCIFVLYVRGKILVQNQGKRPPPLEKNAVANPVPLTLQRYFKLYL